MAGKKPRGRFKLNPDETLSLSINGHTLTGARYGANGWWFGCDSWPELADAHNGAESYTTIWAEFTRRALKGTVKLKVIAANIESR